ncbi:MAG: hypothetical protein IT342_10885 [Candidatus Melainabacteria bacterium]|nr:hypothetical protein [Candidatus Melainabacteria bacterium]
MMNGAQSHSAKLTAAAALQSVLFGLWPLLLIYTITLGDYPLDQLLEPAALVAIVNLSLWSLLWRLYKDAARAAFIVSILSMANFFYLPLADLLTIAAKYVSISLSTQLVLAVYLLILAIILCFAHFGKAAFGKRLLSIKFEPLVLPAVAIVLTLCAVNVFNIVGFENKEKSILREFLADQIAANQELKIDDKTEKPDVYYVVIDGFANSSTLKDMLDYDNSAFIEYLKEKGFYVALGSFSNYDRTILSVTSSLNMQHMTSIADRLGADSVDANVPLRLLQDNSVMKLFKKAGYRIVNVSSGFSPTDHVPQADLNIRSGWGTGFNMALLHLTLVGAFEPYLHLVENEYANVRLAPIRRAAEIAGLPGPKFVLIHCLLTHPPMIFDSEGNHLPLTRQLLSAPYVKKTYIDQLKFTEKKLKELIDVLRSSAGGKSIVILQSDHGSACTDWHQERRFTLERMRILNAYRVPERMQLQLTQTTTPVNSFRLLFRELFGADVPPITDESFIAIPPDELYRFKSVSKILSQ